MSEATHSSPSRLRRVLPALRLVYIELQYWLVGLTPEGYHSAQASAWEDLGNFHRAAKHLKSYLDNSDRPQVRALLAYYYSRLARWPDAAREYTRAISQWSNPSLLLGLAEARLNMGETAEARRLAALVESSGSPLEPYVQRALDHLKPQLEEASVAALDRPDEK